MFNNGIQWTPFCQGESFARVSRILFYNSVLIVMKKKDERIGFRVSAEMKRSLLQIADKEDRSLAQVCELFLRAGISTYKKEGPKYLQRHRDQRPRKESRD